MKVTSYVRASDEAELVAKYGLFGTPLFDPQVSAQKSLPCVVKLLHI